VTSLILETKIADDERQSLGSFVQLACPRRLQLQRPRCRRLGRRRQDETPLKAWTAYDVLVIIGWLGYGEMRTLARHHGST